ncbi:MAG: hypothetical protein CMH64_02760 [Nanoarchaeota archaeon]|nr:hypothetical protein [Nanoarchaeota archaeon]|tara:strand:+ start:190 stop:387 length:198 start_codon:yes stop_codon:yes gene_type:complete
MKLDFYLYHPSIEDKAAEAMPSRKLDLEALNSEERAQFMRDINQISNHYTLEIELPIIESINKKL